MGYVLGGAFAQLRYERSSSDLRENEKKNKIMIFHSLLKTAWKLPENYLGPA